MNKDIEAIFLDHGNTLRVVVKDEAYQAKAMQQLIALSGTQDPPDVFREKLDSRYKAYRKKAKETMVELSERDLWTKWMLPDFPAEKIGSVSGKLTRAWRNRDGVRVARPDVESTIIELSRRGYLLGILANTITETEIPDWLEADGLTGYFKTVILSSKLGIRKPNPEIYLEAARRIGSEPAKCVYVGDNPVRDVEGGQAAGYGMMIVLLEPATLKKEPPTGEHKPDAIIKELSELLDIFPPRH